MLFPRQNLYAVQIIFGGSDVAAWHPQRLFTLEYRRSKPAAAFVVATVNSQF
jgi:hypothetical protein